MDEARDYIKKEGAAVLAKVEVKLNEAEARKHTELDLQLAQFKTVDAESGIESVKTWKDFDADKDSSLSPGEMVKTTSFIYSQLARKVASGEMSKDEAAKQGKNTGITMLALAGLYLGKKAIGKFTKKKDEPTKPPTGPTDVTASAGGAVKTGG
jgi:hypothetical protein